MMDHHQQRLCQPPPPALKACAISNGGACARIKLRFEDHRTILTEQQRHDGLRQSLFLVRPQFQFIADLESDIVATFQLRKACPDGISLSIDGFYLLGSQPIYILKDDDVVSVRKRKCHGKLSSSSDVKLTSSLSIDDSDDIGGDTTKRFGGVKLRVIDEFERETGGYQSEDEDGGVESLVDERIATEAQLKASSGGRRSLKKKRELKQIDNAGGEGDRDASTIYTTRKPRKLLKLLESTKEQGREDEPEDIDKDGVKDITDKHCEAKLKGSLSKTNNDEIISGKIRKGKTPQSNDDREQKKRNDVKNFKKGKDKMYLVHLMETGKDPPNDENLKKRKVTAEDNIQEDATVVIDKVIKLKKAKKVKMASSLNLVQDEHERESSMDETAKKKKLSASKIKERDNEGIKNSQKIVLDSGKHVNAAGEENHDLVQEGRKKMSIEDPAVLEANKEKGTDCREQESARKPSRSALRKRAKRRWKREHAKALGEEEKEPIGRSCGLENQVDVRKTVSGLQKKLEPKNREEDDNEAEEEKLPLVVRPGHIRFEPLDDQEDHNSVQDSMPTILWNYRINKRQGQSWGQEKTMEKIFGKETKMSLIIKAAEKGQCVEPGKIAFESLPSLTSTPQVGDIVAYRVVELTSSMCPELSDYRVGQVAVFESGSKQIKLNALPNYPIKQNLTETEREMESLYNEDGSLEADIMSLVDVRLVQQGDVHELKNSEAQNYPCIPTEVEAQKNENTNKIMDMISEDTTNSMSSVVELNRSPQVLGQGVDTNFASAWQELSQMLDKRKEELSQATGFGSIQNSCKGSNINKARGDGRIGLVANASGGKTFNGRGKSLSYRTIRAGALGPIIAVLREQNAL